MDAPDDEIDMLPQYPESSGRLFSSKQTPPSTFILSNGFEDMMIKIASV
jgi:hypothetical protein